MRLGIAALALLVANGAADAQRNRRNETDSVERACTVTDCFHERDIRAFDVIDRTHLIIYTGPQRCAFHVEVQGTFCDLTFAPDLTFRRSRDTQGRLISRPGAPPPDPLGRGVDLDTLDRMEPGRRDLRICANDIGVQVHGGQFTESVPRGITTPTNRDLLTAQADCRVTGVTSITDDQLLEFFVSRGGLPPPPPIGAAEIEVGEQTGEAATGTSPADQETGADR